MQDAKLGHAHFSLLLPPSYLFPLPPPFLLPISSSMASPPLPRTLDLPLQALIKSFESMVTQTLNTGMISEPRKKV